MPLILIFLGQILAAGTKSLKFLIEIRLNISKKRMFIIDRGAGTLIYLKEKDF